MKTKFLLSSVLIKNLSRKKNSKRQNILVETIFQNLRDFVSAMKFIFAVALLTVTAVATPLSLHHVRDTTNVTIHTRGGATGEGQDSGISISIFSKAKCKGDGLTNQEMLYATQYPQQLKSYHLSDDLSSDDVLSFWVDTEWAATGQKPVDPSLNYNPKACAMFAYNAEGNQLKAGCHTLPNVVGCVTIMIGEAPPPGA